MADERLSRRRQLSPVPAAVEQAALEIALEPHHLLAEQGLRDVEALRGSGETAVAGDLHEVAVLAQLRHDGRASVPASEFPMERIGNLRWTAGSATPSIGAPMVIDIHGHVSAPLALYAYQAQLIASRGFHGKGRLQTDDEEIVAGRRRPRRAARPHGHRPPADLAAAVRDDALARAGEDRALVHRAGERRDREAGGGLPGRLHRRGGAAAGRGRDPGQRDRRARALHHRARLRRLRAQPRSGRGRRPGAAARRRVLVPALREDGRARRARASSTRPGAAATASRTRITSSPRRASRSSRWSNPASSRTSPSCG